MQSPSAPLEEAEYVELAEFLDSVDDAMDIHAAEGFMTAVISAPSDIAASTWQAAILGTPTFRDQEHAQHILTLLMRCYNDVVTGLMGKRTIRPSDMHEDEVSLWCAGYLEAVDLDPVWGDDDHAEPWLVPVAILAGELDSDEAPEVAARKAERMLAKSVLEAYAYFTAKRTGVSTTPAAKVGRNDPCPCGSGNKYKKCCALKLN